jgi:two-component system sensor histidine kinase ChiS
VTDPTTAKPLPHILLVEDSATTATLLTRYLSGHYKLLRANDGEEAWALLQARDDIELVLTDIQMPRLNGHQLLVKIRR